MVYFMPFFIRTPRKAFEKKVRFTFMGWLLDLVKEIIMNIPTDAIVMTVVLIAGFIYFIMQKEDTKPKEIESDEEEWLNISHY